ncbi:hypothetical protein [Brevibacillus parabrevis]|uniref:hypothetical protein n=1 Tax=Brevibacillus parabrevis TaxID=54914 RepID=UPI0028D4021D|nr:hypothetical protein [Brevibacillus parabrevis]
MAQEVIALTCRTCGSLSEPVKMESEFFDIVGFENDVMEWSDFENEVPPLDAPHWVRSDRPPVQGQVRTVKVYHPFHMQAGEPFWMLYTPLSSSLNGWDSHPEEIAQSAFVQCSIECVIARNECQAWLQVKVLEVRMIHDFDRYFPARNGNDGYLDDFRMFRNPSICHYRNWLFISAGAEGDLGVWGLVKQIHSRYHMLAFGDWGFHKNTVFGGNILLPTQSMEELIAQALQNHAYEQAE